MYKRSCYLRLRSLVGKLYWPLMEYVQPVKRRIKKCGTDLILKSRIYIKWLKDKESLPLTREHLELYGIIHQFCYKRLGYFPELVHCRDFNDKIQWLKLFNQDELMIKCCDKLGMREYVAEKIGEQYLVPLLQKADCFDELDLDALPDAFVLKTNHDSGTVIIVRDKAGFDEVSARERITKAMRKPYGWENGEWSYSCFRPKILAEELIDPLRSVPPPDYKFQCVDGVVRFCRYTYDRGVDGKEIVLDRDGNDLGFVIDEKFAKGLNFQKPQEWSSLINICEILSSGFKCVRIDLYLTQDGHIYVGEMTFWPLAGVYTGEGQKELGPLLDFDRTTVLPPIYLNRRKTEYYSQGVGTQSE